MRGGRGGFRGKNGFMGSPPPVYANGLGGEMYHRGFGYIAPGQGQLQGQGMYLMNGGYVDGFGLQRGSVPPPPPMPQTMVPGLDGLRFYVLGQVSLLSFQKDCPLM